MNPFQWLGETIGAWLSGIYTSIQNFFQFAWAWMSNLFNPEGWLLWLAEQLPNTDLRIAGMFENARIVLMGATAAIQIFNLALDLPALGIVIGVILVIELALAVAWAWRGLLSLVPVAG